MIQQSNSARISSPFTSLGLRSGLASAIGKERRLEPPLMPRSGSTRSKSLQLNHPDGLQSGRVTPGNILADDSRGIDGGPKPPHVRLYAVAISRWARKWGVRNLGGFVAVTFSKRMRRSLGRARIRSGKVTLNADLLSASRRRQLEVLCHEVAHIATFQLFGAGARPHGPEWKGLLSAAGYKPSTRLTGIRFRHYPTKTARPIRLRFHCPVCHSTYFAPRNPSRLYCAECLDSGLTVQLSVS